MPSNIDIQKYRTNIEGLLLAGGNKEPSTKIIKELDSILKQYGELQQKYEKVQKEKVKLESEISYQKQQFSEFFDYAPVCYVFITEENEILDANQSALKFLQHPKEELKKTSFLMFLTSESKDELLEAKKKALVTGEIQTLEIRLNIKGKQLIASAHISKFSNQNTEHALYRIVLVDMSLYYSTVSDLKLSKQKYKRLVRHSLDGFVLTNERGQVIEFYKGAEDIASIEEEEAVNHYIWDIYFLMMPQERRSKEAYESLKYPIQRFFMSGKADFLDKVKEIDLLIGNSNKTLQVLPFSIPNEKGFQLGVIIRDLTEQKAKERETLLLASVLNSTKDICIVSSLENEVLVANRAFRNLLGAGEGSKLTGKSGRVILEDAGFELKPGTMLADYFPDGVEREELAFEREEILVLPDGSEQAYLTRRFPVYNSFGQLTARAVISTDVTEKREVLKVLFERENDFLMLFDNMLHGVMILEPVMDGNGQPIDFSVVEVNKPMKNFFLRLNVKSFYSSMVDVWKAENQSVIEDLKNVFLRKRSLNKRYHLSRAERYAEMFVFSWANNRLAVVVQDITARIVAEKAYGKVQMQLLEAQKVASLGHWEWDLLDNTMTWSNEIYNILRENPKSLDASIENFEKKIHPEDFRRFQIHRNKFLKRKQKMDFAHRILLADNSVRYVHERGQIIKDEEGNPISVFGTLQDITKQIEAEKAMEQKDLCYRLMFQNMSSSMSISRMIPETNGRARNFVFLEVNPEFEKITGLSSKVIVGKRGTEIFPWLTETRLEQYAEIVEKRESRRFQEYWEGLDKYFDVVVYSPQPERLAIIHSEITQRIKSEQQLRATSRELEVIFQNAPVIMFLLNREREVLKINRDSERIIGIPKEDAYHVKVGEVLSCINTAYSAKGCGLGHSCGYCGLKGIVEETFTRKTAITKREITLQLFRNGGRRNFVLLVSTLLLGDECEERVLLSVDDITKEKRIEDALVENEERYRRLSDVSTEGIVIHQGGAVLDINSSFLKMFGYEQEEIIGENVLDLMFPKEAISTVKEKLEQDNNGKFESECKNSKGEIFPVEINVQKFSFKGNLAHVTAVRDITEAKELQQRVTKAIVNTEEKDRSFFARELHDGLGPLLSTAKIYIKAAEIAKDKKRRDTALSKLEDSINESIVSVREISSRLSPHILENFGLKVAVESFCSKLKGLGEISYVINVDISHRFDQELEVTLYRVFVELINNTIKHSKATEIKAEFKQVNNKLLMEYRDNGIGFDVEEAFLERKGIGLFNIANRIQSFNGTAEINSEKGKGFVAKIILPYGSKETLS